MTVSKVKPLRISWSGIRLHDECHQRSYLIRQGKRAKVSNIRNFFAGMVVDQIMRQWLDNPLIRYTDTQAVVRVAMHDLEDTERGKGNMVRWRDAADRNEIQKFCTALVTRLEPILTEHVLPYEYEHGKWFRVPLKILDRLTGELREVHLIGEMDLLVQNDGPVVWDLKGTADNSYWRKVVAQLTFYDLAIYASSGTRTRFAGLIQPMCDVQVMPFEITDDMRAEMINRISRYAHDVWREEKTCTKDTATCFYCDVRHACPRYSSSGLDSAFGSLGSGLRAAAGGTA